MPTRHVIDVADGQAVAAVHHEASTDRWLVFCHGFRSDKTGSYEGRCRRAVDEGYNAVRFDFRGCGDSDGRFVETTLGTRLADLRAVVDHFAPDSLALFGSSFGGAVALHAAAADDRVAAVVARAPVTDAGTFEDVRAVVEATGEYVYDTGERVDARFFDDLDRRPFADVVETLDCPVAVFHGGRDESVAPADSFEAARRLATDVVVWKFEDEGHRFSREAERRLRDRAFEWLDGERRE